MEATMEAMEAEATMEAMEAEATMEAMEAAAMEEATERFWRLLLAKKKKFSRVCWSVCLSKRLLDAEIYFGIYLARLR